MTLVRYQITNPYTGNTHLETEEMVIEIARHGLIGFFDVKNITEAISLLKKNGYIINIV